MMQPSTTGLCRVYESNFYFMHLDALLCFNDPGILTAITIISLLKNFFLQAGQFRLFLPLSNSFLNGNTDTA